MVGLGGDGDDGDMPYSCQGCRYGLLNYCWRELCEPRRRGSQTFRVVEASCPTDTKIYGGL